MIHGWLLRRPAYLEIENEVIGEKNGIDKNEWIRLTTGRMARLFAERYQHIEAKKINDLHKYGKGGAPLAVGSKCLVHFTNAGSKLFAPWQGIYRIRSQLDHNCYVVEQIHSTRKKFIVDQKRIRILHKDTTSMDDDFQMKEDSKSGLEKENEDIQKKKEIEKQEYVRPQRHAASEGSEKIES